MRDPSSWDRIMRFPGTNDLHVVPNSRFVGAAWPGFAQIFLLQVSENSCTQPELQPASFLMRSARRPNASLTYSNTLGSAPCARRELLKLCRSESHWRCSLFISLYKFFHQHPLVPVFFPEMLLANVRRLLLPSLSS